MVRRITNNAIWLTIICVIGMLGLNFGNQIIISFQLLVILLMFIYNKHLIDKIIVTLAYLLIGLLLPIYAGFHSGISATFGYVVGFVLCSIPFHFIYNLKLNEILKYILASITSLLVIYICGISFYCIYLKVDFLTGLGANITFYLVADIFKIIFAFAITKILPGRWLE